MKFNKLIYDSKVYSVQGMHRMVTLNILGDLSGHGRNGGGERHVWRRRRYRCLDECWFFCWRRSSTCCYQHRAAYFTRASSISSGVYFDILLIVGLTLFFLYDIMRKKFVSINLSFVITGSVCHTTKPTISYTDSI